jgi:hypothetical protein
MIAATIDDIRWLTSAAAAPWLALAAEHIDSPLECAAKLRRDLSASKAALVQEQAQLRRRAAQKFPAAAMMFFTARGLEQATDATIAAQKSRRFAEGQPVADLCCGIGGDMIAFGVKHPATGVDKLETVAHFAAENVRAAIADPKDAGGASANVHCGDAGDFDVSQVAAWHIDPDRRPDGKRTTRVALHEPSDDVIDKLREANDSAAIKLAPAAELPARWTHEAELEWIGHGRQCQQLVAWFGSLAKNPGERRATSLEHHRPATVIGNPETRATVAENVGRYLFEPHAAVLAAGIWGDLAARRGLASLDARIPYLTSDAQIDDSLLAAFEVLEVLPLEIKRLRAALKLRSVGTLEIKKRGVDVEPEKLRRQLALHGDESLTLVATRRQKKSIAILARRCNP